MDILFGQSYFLRFDPKLWAAMQPYPPLGTMYAASLMRREGYSVSLFDAMLAESVDAWADAINRHKPAYAVIYEDNFNYLSKMCLLTMRQAAFRMIGMAKASGCGVIVAGSDATDRAADYLLAGADYVLLGEGEATLVELMAYLSGSHPGPLAAIAGIAYREDGRCNYTAPRPVMTELDELPFPAWDLVDVARYRRIWREHHGYYSMNMVTTRGCPFHCNWCAKPIWGQRYHSRSPANVAAELKWLKERFDPDHIWFADDIMGLKPGWLPEFARCVEEKSARVPFKCLSRADLLLRDEEDVDALRRAGCQIVWLGAESGSQKILNAMEKGIKVEQIALATRRLQAAGVQVGYFLQFGYPGETLQDIEATLQMVRECRPDDVGISVSYPLPGTKFYQSVKRQLGEKRNWVDSSDMDMMYRGPFTTPFYRQLHRVLHQEFRARSAFAELAHVALKPRRWRSRHVRQAIAAVYRLGTLPLARFRLGRLARLPHGTLSPPVSMSLEEAARPSAQGD